MNGSAALSLREAIRGLVRQKSIFSVAILTLTIGLSLCTAMLCVSYGVILRPLGYDPGRRLVVAWAGYEGGATERDSFTENAVAAWREAAQAFDGVAGFRYTQFTLLQRGEPADLQGAMVSPEFFSVLNARTELGTAFTAEASRSQQGKVVLLSHTLWRQRFAGDPQIVGQAANLGGEIYTVLGVMPADFDVPSQNVALWTPLAAVAANSAAARAKTLMIVARMRPSVTLAQAQGDASALARRLALEEPETHRGMRIHLVPFFDEMIKDARQLLIVASAAAMLVLLICCANVSNLLLMRTIVRRPEFTTRLALGARSRHLLGVIVTESALVAIGGGVLGALCGRWMIEAFLRLSPVELPRAASIGHGWQIPAAAALAVVAATILISVPAAWETARLRFQLHSAVGARSTGRRFAGQLIVALEIAIALTLVVGSGLMARTILALRDANPGWKTDHLLAAQILLPRSGYRDPHQIGQFFNAFVERLRATPGVVSVAASSALPAAPMGVDIDLPIQVPGQSADQAGQAAIRFVTPGIFKTLGIPLLQGRDLDEGDGDPGIRRVVVNQSLVRKYFANSPSVVGRQIVIVLGAPETYEIVGAVGDVHHYGMLQDPKPEFYLSFARRPLSTMGVVVRTAGNPLAFAPTFRKQLWALDPSLPVASTETMEALVRETWNDRTFLTILIVSFTVVVVVLTVVGVFSVVTYSVSRQVRMIAIHMAVGAQSRDVVRLVMKQSARTVSAGVIVGLLGAWLLGRGLDTLTYGVSAGDPRVLLIGILGVAAVAAIGAYLPSRRAAAIDPMIALRLD
jgi:putative ABC transport system permease protein